ncbi:MAG: TonB-dependent receptor, partial [bacterium]|nr:TonB-dependent receptor [Candidatus Kapabacteria bacterium]
RAEQAALYEALTTPMSTRFGVSVRSDNIDVALYHDSARVRLETNVAARIRQRHIAPYVEQEIVLPWAQLQIGLRADYASFDVENLNASSDGSDGVANRLIFSPKANLVVPVTSELAAFANSGFGFHSNDARTAVMQRELPSLARAFGLEVGSRYTSGDGRFTASAAAWQLDLESELVYVGDEGTTEESGRTRRRGVDVEVHATPLDWLSIGSNATLSQGRFRDLPNGENHIPLAPTFTLSGTARATFGDFAVLGRVRSVSDRPANEANTVRALGFTITDLSASYRIGNVELSAHVENIFDEVWNEAQFDTESRLRGESSAVSELHFTPGAPRSARCGVAVGF